MNLADRLAQRYDPEPDHYELSEDPRCLFGWGASQRRGCHHRFGHVCFRAVGHRGRCSDGSDPPHEPCDYAQRPKNWDTHQREQANRE